jgi:hypothetical protein
MKYDFCDSPWGGYTAVATQDDKAVFSATSQTFQDRVLCQFIVDEELHAYSFDLEDFEMSKEIAQAVMLHCLLFEEVCQSVPREILRTVIEHLIFELKK